MRLDVRVGKFTREEATERFRDSDTCAAQSKAYLRGDPTAFFICTNDRGHDQPAHTACDGNGHAIARWSSDTSLIEIWLPDGSWHLA